LVVTRSGGFRPPGPNRIEHMTVAMRPKILLHAFAGAEYQKTLPVHTSKPVFQNSLCPRIRFLVRIIELTTRPPILEVGYQWQMKMPGKASGGPTQSVIWNGKNCFRPECDGRREDFMWDAVRPNDHFELPHQPAEARVHCPLKPGRSLNFDPG